MWFVQHKSIPGRYSKVILCVPRLFPWVFFTLISCYCKVVCFKCDHTVINAPGPRTKKDYGKIKEKAEAEYFKSDATCKVLVAIGWFHSQASTHIKNWIFQDQFISIAYHKLTNYNLMLWNKCWGFYAIWMILSMRNHVWVKIHKTCVEFFLLIKNAEKNVLFFQSKLQVFALYIIKSIFCLILINLSAINLRFIWNSDNSPKLISNIIW